MSVLENPKFPIWGEQLIDDGRKYDNTTSYGVGKFKIKWRPSKENPIFHVENSKRFPYENLPIWKCLGCQSLQTHLLSQYHWYSCHPLAYIPFLLHLECWRIKTKLFFYSRHSLDSIHNFGKYRILKSFYYISHYKKYKIIPRVHVFKRSFGAKWFNQKIKF